MNNPESFQGGDKQPFTYQEGDFIPAQIQYLETPGSYKAQRAMGEEFDMVKHLDRLAWDQEYFQHHFRGQIFSIVENFYICSKEGSYTLDSPDIMLMLARSHREVPEAHLQELRPQDLKNSIKLCEDFRNEIIANGYKAEDVEIGLAGGACGSIRKVHWHIFTTDEYTTLPTKEGVLLQENIASKLGWTPEQSAANQQLVDRLKEAGVNAEYQHFSALIPLDSDLASEDNLHTLTQATSIAKETSEAIFGEEGGYSLSIDQNNLCNLRITRGKQGIVESGDRYLLRDHDQKHSYEQLAKKDQLLAKIIGQVVVDRWDPGEEFDSL